MVIPIQQPKLDFPNRAIIVEHLELVESVRYGILGMNSQGIFVLRNPCLKDKPKFVILIFTQILEIFPNLPQTS